VGDQHAGDADVVDDPRELDLRLLAQLLVERAERLVEEQQLRLLGEAAGEGDALLLAAGELMGLSLRVGRELDELQHRFDARVDLGGRQSLAAQTERDVVENREVRKERVALEHHVHRPHVRRQIGEVVAVERDGSGGRRLEAGEHAKQRRLAAAGRAEQGEDLALGDVDRDVVDGAVAVELLDEVGNAKKSVVGHARARGKPAILQQDTEGVRPSLPEGGVGEGAALREARSARPTEARRRSC
jgi:hypothetical protein